MKFIFALLFSVSVFATSTKQFAEVKDRRIVNIAVEGDAKWKAAVVASGFALVDITGLHLNPGATCSVCDGTDFVNPPEEGQ